MHMDSFYKPGPNGIEVIIPSHTTCVTSAHVIHSQRTGREPMMPTSIPVRYPFGATLHQGSVESIFIDSMRANGVEVERPVVPLSIELSTNQAELDDPKSHPVMVSRGVFC